MNFLYCTNRSKNLFWDFYFVGNLAIVVVLHIKERENNIFKFILFSLSLLYIQEVQELDFDLIQRSIKI